MRTRQIQPEAWLPPGKVAAVCFSIDDVHPGRSTEHYDAGGDMDAGALGLVHGLLKAHPGLHLTLFVTADWREISPNTSKVLGRIPFVNRRLHLARVLPRGTRSLVRHPEFVRYVQALPRTEVGLHGLHHIHPGPRIHVEYQDESSAECRRSLEQALSIFKEAGLARPTGMCPPGWNAPEALLSAMEDLEFDYVASARDIRTDVTKDALASMSGLQGGSLIYPTRVGKRLVHFTSNFQATSTPDRARAILDNGGLLAIKAHIIKDALGFIALDGIDALYCNYLDLLFSMLEREYGDVLWWTTFREVAARMERVQTDSATGDQPARPSQGFGVSPLP